MATNKEIILVTGGNTGLGLEIVRALAASPNPYEIIIGCRTPSTGEAAIETVKSEHPETKSTFSVVQVDLVSDASLEAAAKTLEGKFDRLDVLVNNGGAALDGEIGAGRMSIREAFNATWDVNVAGTHVLTHLLIPMLLKAQSPRLLFLTSGTATLTETEISTGAIGARINAVPPAGWPKVWPGNVAWSAPPVAYRSAKTGLNMVMREWFRFLRNDGVRVWAISPGFLATNLAGLGAEVLKKMGALDPAIGGKLVLDVLEGRRDADVGKIVRTGVIQPW
ncbi:hypothetical protein BX600DRAFT_404175 [Xylariales sp. PMI_506]|nr:hypothetical protein BX600DRAFT_404175 [Xylariales sp. PMI_506]